MTVRGSKNIYIPVKAEVNEKINLSADVYLFKVVPEVEFNYNPGQFFMVSLWGSGEVPISVASLANESKSERYIEFCIRRVGKVTSAIHKIEKGDFLWIRGPYGKSFPLEYAIGRDMLIVGGGIGLAPLRPVLQWGLKNKKNIKKLTLLYGAKTPEDIIFKEDLKDWADSGINVVLTVDQPNNGWGGNIGLVTTLWHKSEIDFKNAVSFICGPEVMIKAATKDLYFFGMSEERIITTLEAHMKCGVGKCGHCYKEEQYICTDGPVFSYKEIKEYNLF